MNPSKRLKAGLALTALPAVLFALGGCGQQSSSSTTTGGAAAPATPAAAPAAQKTVTYAIIPKMLNNPVFSLAQRGAEKAARDLEKENPGTTYNIIYQSSQTGVASEEADTITTLANKKVDGMSISVIDANAVRGPINDAVSSGIPVMCFDSDATGSNRLTLYSVDDEEIGKELANQLIAAVGGKANMTGELGIMSGQSSAPNLQGRVKGVMEVLNPKDFPGITFLPTLYCDDDNDKSVELIRTTMQAHPKLRGWIFVGGWPLFVKNALTGIDPNVTKIVSVDALPPERDYLRAGQVYCLIGQKCFGWGEQSVHILEDYRTGKNKNPGPFVDSGFDIVFKSPTAAQRALAHGNVNVYSADEYDKQWAQWNSSAPGT